MKLFNVLSIAALIFATVACSTGDMMDTESASVNTVASSATSDNAYLSLNINSNAVSTKAADETEATIAQTVTSCTVILYNNDGIQSINDNPQLQQTERSTRHFTPRQEATRRSWSSPIQRFSSQATQPMMKEIEISKALPSTQTTW